MLLALLILMFTSGKECQTNIDECESSPCKNGATCVDGIAEYTCLCKSGYEGDDCETEINECELYEPCENGATCHGKTHE